MDSQEQLRQMLKRTLCFSALDDEALDEISGHMSQEQYSSGEIICREGETGRQMYVVCDGRVSVLKEGKGGEQTAIAEAGPGQVLGEMCLFLGEGRSATLKAKDDVQISVLNNEQLQKILAERPDVAHGLLTCLAKRLRGQTKTLADIYTAEADGRLKIAFFDTKPYTRDTFEHKNDERFALKFFQPRLNADTASLAEGFRVVCAFVNDDLSAPVINRLADSGTELIAMRCAGYNNVDLQTCDKRGVSVIRVPAYSPHAVAEHAVALMLALNRRLYRAHSRVREGNFSLEGLMGFDMNGKTAGVIGTGKIGAVAAKILIGIGCNVLAFDKYRNDDLAAMEGFEYVDMDQLLKVSDIITLHVPLSRSTRYLIGHDAISKMKAGVMIINTSRGGLVDTQALINGLKSGHIGSAGLDVYEEESEYFFEDFSDTVITDDILARLMTFNNVMITSHQGFFTREALDNIAETTLAGVEEFESGKRGEELTNGVCVKCEE